MRKDDAFPGKYLKAGELPEEGQVFTISKVTEEDLGTAGNKDRKPVVWFQGETKGLVLNVTNFNSIAQVTNEPDTDNWGGHKVTLYPTEVEFQGKPMLAIRVRLRAPKAAVKEVPTEKAAAATASTTASANTSGGELTDDDIPF